MSYTHTIVGHFPSHSEAERVVLELQKKGFAFPLIEMLITAVKCDRQL
jgi:hypothetical protein